MVSEMPNILLLSYFKVYRICNEKSTKNRKIIHNSGEPVSKPAGFSQALAGLKEKGAAGSIESTCCIRSPYGEIPL
jgi:hypothetical protein